MPPKRQQLADPLQTIPGVGPSIAEDLRALGFRDPTHLRGRDPEQMYERINGIRGVKQDRCLLYVFRCAVYYAGTSRHQPELLKWWNWKDAPGRSTARYTERKTSIGSTRAARRAGR